MTDPTAMNARITDAVTQTNVKVVTEAPTQTITTLYQIANHSAGLSLRNTVYSQQALNQIFTAVVSKAMSMIAAIEDKKGI